MSTPDRPEINAVPQRPREFVIVDSAIHHYADFVASARQGVIGLHFCADGRAAMRMAKRFRADVWLVAGDLPDMSGFDLLDMLAEDIQQSSVDPLRSGSTVSLGHLEDAGKSRVYVVADEYRIEDEQRALAAGVAGYRVRPVTVDILDIPLPSATAKTPVVATVVQPS